MESHASYDLTTDPPRLFPAVFLPPFSCKIRAKELERFRTDPECFVLLLGKRGAHGLDLSFVTHMFLMEQIWDRSLETQVRRSEAH